MNHSNILSRPTPVSCCINQYWVGVCVKRYLLIILLF